MFLFQGIPRCVANNAENLGEKSVYNKIRKEVKSRDRQTDIWERESEKAGQEDVSFTPNKLYVKRRVFNLLLFFRFLFFFLPSFEGFFSLSTDISSFFFFKKKTFIAVLVIPHFF